MPVSPSLTGHEIIFDIFLLVFTGNLSSTDAAASSIAAPTWQQLPHRPTRAVPRPVSPIWELFYCHKLNTTFAKPHLAGGFQKDERDDHILRM